MENIEHENRTREKLIAHANSIGVTGEFISDLVDEFYSRVRKHPSLGPIFNDKIQDWDGHIYKLKHFWASVCLHSGTYSGRPMPVHMALKNVEPFHFVQWLELFEQTVTELAPNYDVVEYFMERANRIGQSLSLGMFYRP
ncbi:MAG: group III truncated hemoglobin [Caulobacterales bacterium]|nr:group III truncated hemoglobin [Caulobacterales bacterium]MCA0371490.1 group III truncated hemoglobin [Pseudomonadota bacterium]